MPALDARRHRRLIARATLAAILATVALACATFAAGFAIGYSAAPDTPPCTRTVTNLPDPPREDRPRPYAGNNATSVACGVDGPLDTSPWTDAERGNG